MLSCEATERNELDYKHSEVRTALRKGAYSFKATCPIGACALMFFKMFSVRRHHRQVYLLSWGLFPLSVLPLRAFHMTVNPPTFFILDILWRLFPFQPSLLEGNTTLSSLYKESLLPVHLDVTWLPSCPKKDRCLSGKSSNPGPS